MTHLNEQEIASIEGGAVDLMYLVRVIVALVNGERMPSPVPDGPCM